MVQRKYLCFANLAPKFLRIQDTHFLPWGNNDLITSVNTRATIQALTGFLAFIFFWFTGFLLKNLWVLNEKKNLYITVKTYTHIKYQPKRVTNFNSDNILYISNKNQYLSFPKLKQSTMQIFPLFCAKRLVTKHQLGVRWVKFFFFNFSYSF